MLLGILTEPFTYIKQILVVYTCFASLDAVARPDHEPEDLGRIVKALTQRSNLALAGVLTILVYYTQASTPNQALIPLHSFITFFIICLCLLNKAYFEGVPVRIFQKRVKALTAIGAAILYTIPEIYTFLFIVVEGYNLVGWVAVLIVLCTVALHVLIVCLVNSIE
ncbi:hypothetical protein DL96DRAFT_853639 [Flagelloscypha sp. PMI_526]|nr:hypothetical protein DL96DRAFT_853639 [Flagelloscypha sp. PMI_526]